jgi:hypothetical protein
VSADISSPASGTTTQASPVSGRAAMAVLGSMLFLIVALTILLVQNTWVNPASAMQTPPALDQGGLGSR